jgi:tetratricopeptide (TPR) repeat protein
MEDDKQLTFEDDPLFVKQNRVYKMLEEGMFEEAISLFNSILKENPDYPGAQDGIRIVKFWLSKRSRLRRFQNAYDKGKLLLKEWKDFERHMMKNSIRHGRSTVAVQKYIFSGIIDSFTESYTEGEAPDTGVLIQIGDCFKKLGNFEKAIDIYEYTRSFNSEDPSLLAKLGDCYFSIDETSKGKVLFREAFFIDPGRIDLDTIESPLIRMLYDKTREAMGDDNLSIYWLPIIAEVKSVFNVKREPKAGETETLREKISLLENEYINNRKKRTLLEPRLLNHYFWLIDTLKMTGGSRREIESSLQRIHEINPKIFTQYVM